jgi:hypothetical protein
LSEEISRPLPQGLVARMAFAGNGERWNVSQGIRPVHNASLPLSSKTDIGIREAGNERIVPIEQLLRRFAVDALLRLHSADFAALSGRCRLFVHFNLEATTNEVGRRYAVVPIVKAGRRLADGRELLPIIDPAHRRFGTCIEVFQRVPLDEVTAEQLAHSLPNIRTSEQLREALLRRYAPMFPNLLEEEIIARGCAVTRIAFDDL